jgi:hypothetical protein
VSDQTTGRWGGFSDEELEELRDMLTGETSPTAPPSPEFKALRDQVLQAIENRRAAAPVYRGPGRYRSHTGRDCESQVSDVHSLEIAVDGLLVVVRELDGHRGDYVHRGQIREALQGTADMHPAARSLLTYLRQRLLGEST